MGTDAIRLFVVLAFFASSALAQVESIVAVERNGYTIAGLATRARDGAPLRRGIALFPGHPGIMKLREEGGRLQFGLAGNFLVRSRALWLDDDTLVLSIDAPSDQWSSFWQHFRASPRYGADVAALLAEAGRRFGVEDWTFVGTSEGSVSAFHAARMNPQLARRVILTASVVSPSVHGPGVSDVDWKALRSALLWVHHAEDPCRFTGYADARRLAEASGAPLVTVRGGGPFRGNACQAFTQHGFAGAERETVQAMRDWVRTGAVPPDVAR